MRYISIWSSENKAPTPPSPEMMATMGALIQEGMKDGWLIATEGVQFGERPLHVAKKRVHLLGLEAALREDLDAGRPEGVGDRRDARRRLARDLAHLQL